MKKTKLNPLLREHLAQIGARGGRSRSARKLRAATVNLTKARKVRR